LLRLGDVTDDNREDHETRSLRQGREADPMSVRSLRLASALSPEEDRITHQIIGAAITVHRALGPGFLESIYRKAICVELAKRKLSYECERPIDVIYEGTAISGQRLDLIVGGLIVVELKAVSRLEEIHRAQLISYLRTTGLRGGLLINFRVRVLIDGLQRIVLSQNENPSKTARPLILFAALAVGRCPSRPSRLSKTEPRRTR
jgi:GxxExxY protein